jgi:hypothetical protein
MTEKHGGHMKSWKRMILLLIVVLTVLSLLLSACGPVEKAHGNTGYDKDKEKGNGKDNGKPKEGNRDDGAAKITICHKTGSAKHPYVQIEVSDDAARDGHSQHAGDLIPAPEDGCPAR